MKTAARSFVFALLVSAVPAFALISPSVVVNTPAQGATVGIPFLLNATASACSGQPVSATGYSLDYGATTFVYATTINTQVTATIGAHTLHVKSWGTAGSACGTDVPIAVSVSAAPALITNVTVSQPAANAELVSPFTLIAAGTLCDSQPIGAIGFSIDNSSNTTIVTGTSVNAPVTSTTGAHTLHVKSWGTQGAGCVTNIPIVVMPSPVSLVPADAIVVKNIQTLTNWQPQIDLATNASASTLGETNLVSAPSLSGQGRQFATNFIGYGGERYEVSFGADTSAHNFLYDTWVYVPNSASDIANLEFDMNQVMPNGETVIFGFQCDYWSSTWDYTANTGTPKNYTDAWLNTKAACNVQSWTFNTWHHVQVSYMRDDAGNVTYQSVWFDNVEHDMNITAPSAFALGWSPTLITNFQVDSLNPTEASATAYLDNMTVYRW